nr:thiamine transport system substrate-binding protein [Candidatus Cloacimonadota bacterium]
MRKALLIALFILTACTPQNQKNQDPKSENPDAKLKIYALTDFASSGLQNAIIPDFERDYNCQVELSFYGSPDALIRALRSPQADADIIFGIPSSFAASDSLDSFFLPYSSSVAEDLAKDCHPDLSSHIMPYGFSYLCLIYNSSLIENPPASFGELQDARFLNSMALLDPLVSGCSRASIQWIVSIFGSSGYNQMLRALRKNVSSQYVNPQDALAALQDGDSKLVIGLSTWPAWQKEINPQKSGLDFVLFSEGSFLYTECLGIHRESKNPALAGAFVDYALSPPAQKMIIYKLGLFPANRKTMLPPAFSDVPFSARTTNDRLSSELIFRDTQRWLDNWQRYLLR